MEPFIPEAFRYHAASAIIENGDFEAAVEKATQRANESVVTGRVELAPVLMA